MLADAKDAMFKPYENANQHYVPQFWQKRFAGSDHRIHKLSRGQVKIGYPKKLMTGAWIYTTFDFLGMPSNRLETGLSKLEGQAAEAMKSLDAPGSLGTLEDQVRLRFFIALSACRHPDTMGRGHRLSKELAYTLADVGSMNPQDFQVALQRYGMTPADAQAARAVLNTWSDEELLRQAEDVEYRAPNDPVLPAQLALDPEVIERVFFMTANLSVTILDAPPGHFFVLGDTPLPPGLAKGFTVPLCSTLALLWESGGTDLLPDWTRRPATVDETEQSNCEQVSNAAEVVIGPTEAVLQQYISTAV